MTHVAMITRAGNPEGAKEETPNPRLTWIRPATRAYLCCDAFLAVYELGTVKSASVELEVTCATVYNRLRSLEEVVAEPLFHREKGELVPSAAATILANMLTSRLPLEREVKSLVELARVVTRVKTELDKRPAIEADSQTVEPPVSELNVAAPQMTPITQHERYFLEQLHCDVERAAYRFWLACREQYQAIPSLEKVLSAVSAIAGDSFIGCLRLRGDGFVIVEYANSKLKKAFKIQSCPVFFAQTMNEISAELRVSVIATCINAQRPMRFVGFLPHPTLANKQFSRLLLPVSNEHDGDVTDLWANSVVMLITECADQPSETSCSENAAYFQLDQVTIG